MCLVYLILTLRSLYQFLFFKFQGQNNKILVRGQGSYIITYSGAAESDMDLDLLAESESDSESSHSNQDNVSVQRSAVTAATAGSDAGTGT